MKKLLFLFFSIFMSIHMYANAYVKVITSPDNWNGRYLIVYEGDDKHTSVAFNGNLETLDAANNGINVQIIGDSIVSTDSLVTAEFIINDGVLISKSGYEIGKTAYSNGLDASKTKHYTNTFAIDENNNAIITASGGCILKYNYASDQLRFRYYKSGQKYIALYKFNGSDEPLPPIDLPVVLGEKTIAEFLELKNEKDTCILTGVVDSITNTTYGNLYMSDSTAQVYVYGVLTPNGVKKAFNTLNVGVNDTLTIKATYGEYNNKPEIMYGVFVEVKKQIEPIPADLESLYLKSNTYKIIKNGEILIYRDDKIYNIYGRLIQQI